MDLSKLKDLRSIVPGALILAGAVPIYLDATGSSISELAKVDKLIPGLTMAAVAYVIGWLYNVYCLRAAANRKSHARINANIKKRLLEMGRTAAISNEKREELLAGKALMIVFYSLIDSNDSLKEKAKLVRHNGLIWSSAADVTLIGSLYAAIYLPVWLSTGRTLYLVSLLIALGAAFVARFIVHPTAEKKHISLGDDQLDFMELQMKDKVEEKVNAL
jgi:hypothetical protein